jgi:hypothetical protein
MQAMYQSPIEWGAKLNHTTTVNPISYKATPQRMAYWMCAGVEMLQQVCQINLAAHR